MMNRFNRHKQEREARHSVQWALRSAASAQQAGSVHGFPQFHLAGAVDDTLHGLGAQMQEGDIIVNGGNSYYIDDNRCTKELNPRGVDYLDVGNQ